jgi:hypothetical protein
MFTHAEIFPCLLGCLFINADYICHLSGLDLRVVAAVSAALALFSLPSVSEVFFSGNLFLALPISRGLRYHAFLDSHLALRLISPFSLSLIGGFSSSR